MKTTQDDLIEAKRQIDSIVHKLKETINTLEKKDDKSKYKSQISLAQNRIKALVIASKLIDDKINKVSIIDDSRELLINIDKVKVTQMSANRVRKNLCISVDDVTKWCKNEIKNSECQIVRKGKNWYVTIEDFKITINANSFTIITAHRIKDSKQ